MRFIWVEGYPAPMAWTSPDLEGAVSAGTVDGVPNDTSMTEAQGAQMDERLEKLKDQATKAASTAGSKAAETASKARKGLDDLVEKNRDRIPDRVEQLYDKVAKKSDDNTDD